jgi:hypothetical protein
MQGRSLLLPSDGETIFEDEGELYHFRHDELDDPTPTEPALPILVIKDWTPNHDSEEETTKVLSIVLLG